MIPAKTTDTKKKRKSKKGIFIEKDDFVNLKLNKLNRHEVVLNNLELKILLNAQKAHAHNYVRLKFYYSPNDSLTKFTARANELSNVFLGPSRRFHRETVYGILNRLQKLGLIEHTKHRQNGIKFNFKSVNLQNHTSTSFNLLKDKKNATVELNALIKIIKNGDSFLIDKLIFKNKRSQI